ALEHGAAGRVAGRGVRGGFPAVGGRPLRRPFPPPPADVALDRDWECKMERLAREAAGLPITMLSGVPSWLLVLFDRLRRLTGKGVPDVWPMLRLVIHGGTRFDPYRGLFRRLLGDGVRLLETYPASEGFVATEDPR